MKVIFSFDYELFFGEVSGSPEKCMVEPAEALAAVAAEYGAPLCFFVDAGYLTSLRRFARADATVRRHETMIRQNLDTLASQGHEILLHVHPHWEDTHWREGRWSFDLSRFALRDFDAAAVADIVIRYSEELRPHAPGGRLHAYRAGGWAIQPFAPIGAALKAAGIRVDSTVYRGGLDGSGKNYFDFSDAPPKCRWRFEADPVVEDPRGSFLEIPAASMTVSPSYYWRLAFGRLAGRAEAKPFGDGTFRPMESSRSGLDTLRKLTAPSRYCVTLDGMKASLAHRAYQRARQQGSELLVLLSHPKMLTSASIASLRRLIEDARANGDEIVGYEHFASIDDAGAAAPAQVDAHTIETTMSEQTQTFRDPLVPRVITKLKRIARSTSPGLACFRMLHRGDAHFSCPVCGYRGPFVTLRAIYGERRFAECPKCGALERHRLLSDVLDEIRNDFPIHGKSIVHFAPEPFFRLRFQPSAGTYTTADLVMRNVDLRADLCDLPFRTASHDMIFASYILQYVQDDMQALREIHRVLRPGGIAILPVTVVAEKTIEYPEPNMLESGGHVRAPGADYYDRFKQVFARVDLYESGDFPGEHQLYVYENRSNWPTAKMPLRLPMPGIRHREIVPVCWR